MTIIEFLLARVAEDQVHAETFRNCGWSGFDYWGDGGDLFFAGEGLVPGAATVDRTLADVAAKQRMLAMHPCDDCGLGDDPCLTLRLLATPYAAHPDYRTDWWRP